MTSPELPFYQRKEVCRILRQACWPLEAGGVRVGVQASRSRSVPGFFILRVPRFGRSIPRQAIEGTVHQLAGMARDRNVLRMHLEAWTEDAAQMDAIQRACEANGFRATSPCSYARTVWMELLEDPEETFMQLSPQARRRVRAPGKKGFAVRQIRSTSLSPRLQAMLDESFARTGSSAPRMHWKDWIELSLREPTQLRLTGLFRDDDEHCGVPLAFAVAVRHGDVAEYAHAGSSHSSGVRVPLLYSPTWDLMCWAKDAGARWWDFGGISGAAAEDTEEDDPRGGIDAFKLFFSRNVVEVGREWVLEPHPWLAKVGKSVRFLLKG